MRTSIAVCDHVFGGQAPVLERGKIHVISDVCANPAALRDAVNGGDRLALGLCARAPSTAELQARARAAGLDAFLIEPVDLRAYGDRAADAVALLEARAAGLVRRSATSPRELRMRIASEGVSRRSLFRLGPLTYDPVAAVDPEECRGADRCSACIEACPVNAARPAGRTPVIDKDACLACGACVTACPAGAVAMPGPAPGDVGAQIAHLAGRGAIAFVCKSARAAQPERVDAPGWLPIDVPCLSEVATGWILQALAAGAPGVALVGCGTDCRAGTAATSEARAAWAARSVAHLGIAGAEERIRFCPDEPPGVPPPPMGIEPSPAGGEPPMREPDATSDALLRIRQAIPAAPQSEERTVIEGGPLGRVEVNPARCTLCASCVIACPTSALSTNGGPVTTALDFDPASCIACGSCERACPEHVVTVTRATDVADLEVRRLKADTVARCVRCGTPIGPSAMLERVRALLPDATSEMLTAMTQLCGRCRGAGPAASPVLQGAGRAHEKGETDG